MAKLCDICQTAEVLEEGPFCAKCTTKFNALNAGQFAKPQIVDGVRLPAGMIVKKNMRIEAVQHFLLWCIRCLTARGRLKNEISRWARPCRTKPGEYDPQPNDGLRKEPSCSTPKTSLT